MARCNGDVGDEGSLIVPEVREARGSDPSTNTRDHTRFTLDDLSWPRSQEAQLREDDARHPGTIDGFRA